MLVTNVDVFATLHIFNPIDKDKFKNKSVHPSLEVASSLHLIMGVSRTSPV